MIAIKDKKYNDLLLVKFESQDFPAIKSFILRVCQDLEDSTFFITSDIDTVLPELLKVGKGLVYGALYNGTIVATQAINFDAIHEISVRESIRGLLPMKGMESTWTMVSSCFRSLGIAYQIGVFLEDDAYSETSCNYCFATIHPLNTASLGLYFRMGYVGIDLTYHYGVLRMVLVKRINLLSIECIKEEEEYSPVNNINTQRRLFNDGHICLGFEVGSDRHILHFSRLDLSSLLY